MGVGRTLATHAVAEADQVGIVEFRLTVQPGNHVAMSLYGNSGFGAERLAFDHLGSGGKRLVRLRMVLVSEKCCR